MKRLVLSTVAVATIVAASSSSAQANDYETRRQLIIRTYNAECRMIGLH